MQLQHTLKKEVSASGIGLHSGKYISIRMLPAGVNNGISFKRIDLDSALSTSANVLNVVKTSLGTTLGEAGCSVATVEHLMASFIGLGIDNIIVEIDDEEIPIFDGSAATMVYLLDNAGLVAQELPRRYLKVLHKVEIREGDKYASIEPYDGYSITLELAFSHPAVDKDNSYYSYEFSRESFLTEIANARTFGFLKDIEFLRNQHLTLGGNIDNAIVLDDKEIINTEGLRFTNEFVRHKVLDVLGDLYLIGAPILGRFHGVKSGHALNIAIAKLLLSNEKNYEWVNLD
jgi:UDP-3-O-[3-hydroxymyristoyl] N-acetylglucosamine deacetylase